MLKNNKTSKCQASSDKIPVQYSQISDSIIFLSRMESEQLSVHSMQNEYNGGKKM